MYHRHAIRTHVLSAGMTNGHSMPSGSTVADVKKEIDRLNQAAGSVEDFMWETVKLLHDRMLKYNWVGFYMLEDKSPDSQPRMLALGPFQGAMTPHTRIPLNQGICGAAATMGKTIVVDDVTLDNRYLACSTETKSEIVVPVFVRNRSWANWTSTATSLPLSETKTANWWSIALPWWANSWKSFPG